MRVLTRI